MHLFNNLFFLLKINQKGIDNLIRFFSYKSGFLGDSMRLNRWHLFNCKWNILLGNRTQRKLQSVFFNIKQYYTRIAWLLIVIGIPSFGLTQNIHNLEHSVNFANYLFKTGQYQLASEEYERIVFQDSANEEAKINLIKSYRLSKNYTYGLKRTEDMFNGKTNKLNQPFSDEYFKLLLLSELYDTAKNFLACNNSIEIKKKNEFNLQILLLERNWKSANQFILNNQFEGSISNSGLISLTQKSSGIKTKSPFLALSLSAVVPGLGKFYTKNWKDGLISLLMVAANSWQSYRGFHKYGSKSAYGWIFGGLALGFYGGNVYGSYKSAKVYNIKQEDKITEEAKQIIYSGLN